MQLCLQKAMHLGWGPAPLPALKLSLQDSLTMHNAALQPCDMHVAFTCCAKSFMHFNILTNVCNEKDILFQMTLK